MMLIPRMILTLFLFFSLCVPAFCLSDQDVIALKHAGVGEELLRSIIREKTIETCAFTVDEIVSMKKAGLSDDTINVIVKEGSFLKDREPAQYGRAIRSIKASTIGDILDLKKNGMTDELIRAIVVFSSSDSSEKDRSRAWEMLKSMGIIIDGTGSEER